MRYSDLAPNERIFLLMCEREEEHPIAYLASLAILFSEIEERDTTLLDGYTRGDFKRAIKFLRERQKEFPQYAAAYEDAVLLIRRDWLHREPGADADSEAGEAVVLQGRAEH